MALIDPGKYCFGGFFVQMPNQKSRKKYLGSEFSKVFFGKMKPKNSSCQSLEWTKMFHSTKIECFVLWLFLSFFFFNWVTLWMNKLRNFICKPLECKDFPCSKIYSCTLSQEFMWIQPEFTHCFNFFVKFAACGKYPPALFLLLLNWFLNFLPALSVRFFSYFYRFSFDFVFFWWRTFQFFPLMI